MKKRNWILMGIAFIIGGTIVYTIIIHPITKSGPPSFFQQALAKKTSFNMLLLGYGGGTHDGAYLTDSIMAAHIDPQKKTVTLISIPRDSWVEIPTNGTTGNYWKANAAYELGMNDTDFPNKLAQYKGTTGPGNLAKDTVETITGLHMDKFVALDFSGFTKVIDAIGGIDVQVEQTFDDYEYPVDGKESDLCGKSQKDLQEFEKTATESPVLAFPCRYEHLHFDKGTVHMDGKTALKFARSRHSTQDGTDFGRSARQQNVINAFKKKIFSINFIPRIPAFINSLRGNLATDLTTGDIAALIPYATQFKSYTIQNSALTNGNVLKDSTSDDGQYILIPREGTGDWSNVHSFVETALNPQNTFTQPVIQVQNGTHINGLAGIAGNRLKEKFTEVLPPETAEKQTYDKTIITIYDSNIDPQVIATLEKEYKTKATIDLSANNTRKYNILIIVGQDYNQTEGKKLINE